MKWFAPLLLCLFAVLIPVVGQVHDGPGRSPEDLDLEQFLLTADVVLIEEIGQGITKPKRLTLAQGGRVLRASFKTVDETRNKLTRSDMYELEFTDRFIYEVAAYRIDRLLDMRLVPVAVVREIDGVPGTVQAWIEGAVDMQKLIELGQGGKAMKQFREETQWMLVLDALIYNVDRNPTNILILKNGKGMYLIDHSRAFRLNGKLPGWTAEAFGVVPKDAVNRLQAMDRSRLLGELEELLGKGRTLAVDKRRRKLLKLLGE